MFQKKPKTKAVSTTPGPLNQLTQKTYIERGSMQAVDKRMWQYVATFSLFAAIVEGIAIAKSQCGYGCKSRKQWWPSHY